MSQAITSSDLEARLARRYPREKGWCLFTEVPNASWGGTRRTDALVLNLSSQSQTLEGFEIKVSRADWLNELRQPEKSAQGLLEYVNRWWLVVGSKDLVKDGELPEGWGLLIPRGKNLVARVQARPNLKPKELNSYVCAVLIRRMWDRNKSWLKQQIEERAAELAGPMDLEREERIRKDAQRDSRSEITMLRRALDEIQSTLGLKFVEEEGARGWKHGTLEWGGLSRWELAPLIRCMTGEEPGDFERSVLDPIERADQQLARFEGQLAGYRENLANLGKKVRATKSRPEPQVVPQLLPFADPGGEP